MCEISATRTIRAIGENSAMYTASAMRAISAICAIIEIRGMSRLVQGVP